MKKVLKIILVVLAICIAVAGSVLYAVFPTEFTDFVNNFWDVLNRPLPIVGVTSVAILIFLWRVFVSVNYGKKRINEYKQNNEETKNNYKQLYEEEHEANLKEREQNRQEIKFLREQIIALCKIFPNVKVNQLGERIEKESNDYGEREETIDGQTEAD